MKDDSLDKWQQEPPSQPLLMGRFPERLPHPSMSDKLRSSVYSKFRGQRKEERRGKKMDRYDVQLQRVNDLGPTKFLK